MGRPVYPLCPNACSKSRYNQSVSTSSNLSGGRTMMSEPTTLPMPQVVPEQEQQVRRQPPYNVILLNDDDHTYEYVIRMLKEIFAFPEEKGYRMADEVHRSGRVIVLTTTLEHAELKRDQIH